MGDDGAGVRRVAGFDPAEEVEEGGGILRHAVIWPGSELELTHFPSLAAAALRGKKKKHGQMVFTQSLVMAYEKKTNSLNGANMVANLFACGLPATSALIMT